MPKLATQDRVILYAQPSGPFTALEPLSIGNHGRGDASDDTIPGSGILFGRNEFAQPRKKVTFFEAPGGQVTFQVDKDALNTIDVLDKRRRDQGRFNLVEFFIPYGAISTFTNWINDGYVVLFPDCSISGGGPGGHSKDFSGQPVADNDQVSASARIKVLPFSISSLTTSETEDINDVVGLADLDPNRNLPGYPGADKVLLATCDAASAATANVLYSVNGGSSWTAFGADPFAADEHTKAIEAKIISPTQYRVVVLRLTVDAANPPEIAWATITFGDESTSPTWTAVDLGSTNNDAGEALFWALYGRLYAGAGGDIFVSTDQGESFTEIYTGSNALADFAMDSDENVWAVGASNTILRERESARGTFEAKTGPSGGGAFTSIAVAEDGTIFAGNGTSLYRSSNEAASTGGWTQIKDFGTNHAVKGIYLLAGNSQFLKVLVSDTSGNEGDVWYSFDGGNSFTEVTNATNSGYNAWWHSPTDPNFAVIAGEDDGSTGVLHKVS